MPPDGAANGQRATAGLHVGNQPTWVACRVQRRGPFSGAPRRLLAASSRTALRALPSALAGVQPATVLALRPSNAGKAAVSSRHALPLRRDSVVSTSEAGTDDAGNTASCKVAVPVCRDNGGTTGFDAR